MPVIQKKRRELAEQQKINRSKLLIKASTAQYEYDNSAFPISRFAGVPVPTPTTADNYLMAAKEHINHSTQHLSTPEKPTKENEHIEQILSAHMSKIEIRLSTLESTLTSQLSELEHKIDNYTERFISTGSKFSISCRVDKNYIIRKSVKN